MCAVKDVVSERECHPVVADKVAADDECLREPFRSWLHREVDVDAKRGAVVKKSLEPVLFVGRGDHENPADSGEHQRR